MNIIVIGGTHHNSLGVIRALGEKGYSVEFINYSSLGKNDYISKSKYINVYKALSGIEHLSAYLLNRPISEKKEIIISCADVVTEYLNIHQNELVTRYIIPGVPEQGKIVELMDKTTMIDMTAKRGIFAPKVWLLPQDKDQITFPCITKCHISSQGRKTDIHIIYSKEQLEAILKNKQDNLFAQAFINKKEEVQLIGCSLHGGKEIIIPGMSKIIRSQHNTNTGFLEYLPLDPFYNDIVERAKLYIRDCNYSGLFSFEVIRDTDDKIWFLEINFRNDGNALCVTRSGVNLPVIWVKSCMNEDFTSEIRKPNHILMMPEFQDFKLVIQNKVRFSKWLKDWKRTDYFMEYDRNDSKPFLAYIINVVLKIFHK